MTNAKLKQEFIGFKQDIVVAKDNVSLNAYTIGDLNKPTIVFCNAIGVSKDILLPLVNRLTNDYSIVTWDTRTLCSENEGGSEDNVDVSFPRLVNDIKDILDYYGIKKCLLIGWCNGARLALKFASIHKDKVEGLLGLNGEYIIGKKPAAYEKTNWQVMSYIAASRKNAESYFPVFNKPNAKEASQKTYNEHKQYIESSYSTITNLYKYAKIINEFTKEPICDQDFNLTSKVKMMSGLDDEMVSLESTRELVKHIHNAEHQEFKGIDHYGLFYSNEYQQQIVDFIHNCLT